jgi:hypothetical protein
MQSVGLRRPYNEYMPLREAHQFDINVRTILEQFKDKMTRGAAKLAVTDCIEFFNQIRINPHMSEHIYQASFSPYTGSKPDLIRLFF